MNREIKFRAWSERNGGEMIPSEKLVIWGNCMYCNDSMELNGKIKGFSVTKIMQFTGLKDKNGMDIYEGDILKENDYGIFEVIWSDEWCKYKLDCTRVNNNIQFPEWNRGIKMEIIGNIHSNPELIIKN